MPKNYTVKEVADILGFSTNSIYSFLKEKRIKGVRFGRGRFRIPEEELSRILHLSKKSEQAIIPPAQPQAPQGDAAFIDIQRRERSDTDAVILPPNIFDWFVGLAAVVAGAGLFLFNSSVVPAGLVQISAVFPVIRIVLVSCGLGIIISSIFTQGRGWHGVFHFALCVTGIANAYALATAGDVDGAFLYGALALVIGFTNIVHLGGIVSIGLYASLIAMLLPLTMVVFPFDSHVQMLSAMLGMPALSMGLLFLAVAIALVTAWWLGYVRSHGMFTGATWILVICDVVAAVWYAYINYWSRSFFLVVVGFFTGLLPYWWQVQQTISRRYTLLLHGMLLVVGSVLTIALFVVYILQQNMWQAREIEFANKIRIAQSQLQSAIQSVESSVAVASGNMDFVDAVTKKDLVNLTSFSKIIYESNPNIRRLVFLDAGGDGIALYPYGTFDEPNFAFRDYFQQAKSSGQPYISDVYQAKADNAGRYIVVVAVPLHDRKGVFSGVMAASVDLDRMSLQLAQIAVASRGEYFVVSDNKGVILSHPNQTLIGSTAPASDPLYRGIRGEAGVIENAMIEKKYGMIAYADVPKLRWAISLRVPSGDVFVLTSVVIWSVFGSVGIILLISIALFSFVERRIVQKKEGGT